MAVSMWFRTSAERWHVQSSSIVSHGENSLPLWSQWNIFITTFWADILWSGRTMAHWSGSCASWIQKARFGDGSEFSVLTILRFSNGLENSMAMPMAYPWDRARSVGTVSDRNSKSSLPTKRVWITGSAQLLPNLSSAQTGGVSPGPWNRFGLGRQKIQT